MTVRCKNCNKVHSFRNYRGNKLSEHKCDCGGSLEMVGGMHKIAGKHPFDEGRTYTSQYWEGEFFYADKNKKGEYFIIHEDYYYQIVNPTFPTKKLLTTNQ